MISRFRDFKSNHSAGGTICESPGRSPGLADLYNLSPGGTTPACIMLLQLCGGTVVVRNRCRRTSLPNECRPSGTRTQKSRQPRTSSWALTFRASGTEDAITCSLVNVASASAFPSLLPISYGLSLAPNSTPHASARVTCARLNIYARAHELACARLVFLFALCHASAGGVERMGSRCF